MFEELTICDFDNVQSAKSQVNIQEILLQQKVVKQELLKLVGLMHNVYTDDIEAETKRLVFLSTIEDLVLNVDDEFFDSL